MTKEYLKMADAFVGTNTHPVLIEDEAGSKVRIISFHGGKAEYAAHAINSHDELVAEVERLRELLSECYPFIKDKADWGTEYEMDLAGRVFDAAGTPVSA